VLLISFLFFYTDCYCQDSSQSICWYSKKYINAISNKDTIDIKNALIPIEGFEQANGTLYVLTYMGEITPLHIKKIEQNGIEVLQLLNLKYYFNLKYLSEDLVERYSKAIFYLKRLGDTIELTIVESNQSEKYYFINNYESKRFSALRTTKEYLLQLR
jgi:hypothetical protein